MTVEIGNYTLNDVEFIFAFDGDQLKLFPDNDKEQEKAMSLTHHKIHEEAYSFPGDPIKCQDEYQVLRSLSSNRCLVLFPVSTSYGILNLSTNSLSLDIGDWISLKSEGEISGLLVSSPILDYSYDIQSAISAASYSKTEGINIKSDSKPGLEFQFSHKGNQVNGYISHQKRISFAQGTKPFDIVSWLSLNFEPTKDYGLIREYAHLIFNFLSFLIQGSCFAFGEANVLRISKDLEGKEYPNIIGDYFFNAPFSDSSSSKRIINIESLPEMVPLVFQALSDEKIVMDHLPKVEDKDTITVARLIMMFAALDKTLNRIYPKGIKHSKKAQCAKKIINDALDELIQHNELPRVHEEVSFLRKNLNEFESFKSRLCQFRKDHLDIFTNMKEKQFADKEQCYDFFGKLQSMRNKLAHGDFTLEHYMEDDAIFDYFHGLRKILLSTQFVLIGIENDVAIASIVDNVC